MTPEPTPARDTADERPWTSQDLAALDALVSRVRQHPNGVDDLALEVELETAREELRVADEEIRVQRDQLQELLELREAAAVHRRHVASLLPLPMLSTDGSGRITEANPAAAARLNVPLVRLPGKPVATFVHEPDRKAVRGALSAADPEPRRLRVHLTPRRTEPVLVDVVLSSTSRGDDVEVEWTVLDPGTETAGTTGVDPVRLAAAVAEISRLPIGATDVRPLLAALARTTATAVADGASVSVNLGHPAEPTQLAATSELALVADGLQIRTGEGPCVDAYVTLDTVVVDDLSTDGRWPRLRAAWHDSTAAAVIAVPVMAGGVRVGVLNCYSTVRGLFTEARAQAAEVLALAAGGALEAVQETRQLRRVALQLDQALESRAVIDQAKGIVMARRGCTADEAFTHLARLSQERNVKLRELARALVEQAATAAPSPVSRPRS